MTDSKEKRIKFFGNQIKRDDSLQFVDRILREKGETTYGVNLKAGLDALADTCSVRIIDDDDSFALVIEPDSADSEIHVTIHSDTGTLYIMNNEDLSHDAQDDDMDFLDDV